MSNFAMQQAAPPRYLAPEPQPISLPKPDMAPSMQLGAFHDFDKERQKN